MLKRFSVVKNPIKIGPPNGRFRNFKGINIKYSHRNPPPRHFFTWNDVFCSFALLTRSAIIAGKTVRSNMCARIDEYAWIRFSL